MSDPQSGWRDVGHRVCFQQRGDRCALAKVTEPQTTPPAQRVSAALRPRAGSRWLLATLEKRGRNPEEASLLLHSKGTSTFVIETREGAALFMNRLGPELTRKEEAFGGESGFRSIRVLLKTHAHRQ